MKPRFVMALALTIVPTFALGVVPRSVAAQAPAANVAGAGAEIDAFNRALSKATREMDNAATMALWADDGVSLLPSMKPIVGKAAIGAFITQVTSAMPNARMTRFDMRCRDITISGDWASEWCTEHQVVELGGGKPPFDGWGKMLLVLHRSSDEQWRLEREMWNQAVADSAALGH
jgi:ketosteroid isomerase-like protein